MKLNKYDMSHNWHTAYRIGQLFPTMIQDVTPGEIWHGKTTSIIRLDPLNKPTYMSLKHFTRTFYIPYRVLDDGFAEWWAGQNDAYTVPTVDVGNSQVAFTKFYQMFGIPITTSRVNHLISAYAIRAYNKIWNDHFRKMDINEVALDTLGIHRVFHPAGTYFGNMRDDMQVGSAVSVDSSGPTIDVPDIRDAMAMQRLQEHRKLYGDKYIDQLKRFGVTVPYGFVDESVPVASGKGTIGISEVVETATTTESNSGQMTGHGIVMYQQNFKPRKFLEPGILMEVQYARPRLFTAHAINRIHQKAVSDDTSFYQPELALKSDTTVKSDEIYALVSATNYDYAYVDNYDWLRTAQDVVAGEMVSAAYDEWSAHKRTSLGPLDTLQYVDDYDDLFQNAASSVRADMQVLAAHRLKKLSPVRRKGRS